VTVHPHATRRQSHLGGCARFWLWALAGAGLVLGFVSLGLLLLLPAVVFIVVLARRTRSGDSQALLGLVSGAGLPLLLVAGINWNDWQHRVVGDGTPNPYYWGGLGLCLLVAGVVAYGLLMRRSE
jgi:uncharacterized membrane protein YidH (DUF202 family)